MTPSASATAAVVAEPTIPPLNVRRAQQPAEPSPRLPSPVSVPPGIVPVLVCLRSRNARNSSAWRRWRIRNEHAGDHVGRHHDRRGRRRDVSRFRVARRGPHHPGSHLPAAEGRRGGAGADARPRGSHRWRAPRAAVRQGSGLRHAADAGAGRAQAARARARGQRVARHRSTQGPRDGRSVLARIHPRDAQHPGLRGGRHPHADRRAASTPATSRSIRRRSTVSISTCTASRSSAPRACWRCLPTAPTSIATASPARKPTSCPRSRRSSRARRPGWWSRPLPRVSTASRFSSTWRSSSIGRWRLSGAA